MVGQNPLYFKIDKIDGLPSNAIYDINQDKHGFIWLATDEGLCKYDGKKVITFQNVNQTSKSGSCIIEDKYGRIWYSNFDGKLFYVSDNKLHPFTKNKPFGYNKFGIVDNYLFTIEENKINIYDIRNFSLLKTIPINTYIGIVSHSSKENFYVIVNTDLYIISNKLTIKKLKLPPNVILSLPLIQNVKENLIFISNTKQTPGKEKVERYGYILQNNRFIPIEVPKNTFDFFQNLTSCGNQNWICTTKGAYQMNGTIISPQKILSEFNITAVFKDNSNQYWFGTNNQGVLLVPNLEDQFIPTPATVSKITINKDAIYLGTTNDQIFKTNLNSTSFEPQYKGDSNHEIGAMAYDSDNSKIVFTTNKFKIVDKDKKVIQEEFLALKDLVKLDQSYYAFAATGLCGLLHISDSKSDWDSFYQHIPEDPDENLHPNIKRIFSVGRGKSVAYNPLNQTMYFATGEGLFFATKKKVTELKYHNASIYYASIKKIDEGIIGITYDGVIHFIDAQNHIRIFDYARYINKEKATSIQVSGNDLFIITPLSVYQYNWSKKNVRKVLIVNPEFELNDLVVKDDYFYFGTSKGILKVLKSNENTIGAPKIILNDLKVNDIHLSPTKNNVFESNENTIAVNFSVLNFIPNQKNQVYYKINGQNWKIMDNDSRELLLNSLSPGNYEVLLKSKSNGAFSPLVSISFTIKNPIWLQWWFVTGLLFLALFLFYLAYQWKIKKMARDTQQIIDRINLEKNANQSKLKAIKSQMNPHFFYNALNTIQSYILSNDKKQAVTYLSKFSSLTRTILEMTEKDWVSISEEVKALRLYLDIEKARFDADFDYTIVLDPLLETDSTKIPSMLLQPYVENAIKHGLLHKSGQKTISVSFQKHENYVQIKIDDNGIGRKKSEALNSIKHKNHKSFATQAMQHRIELLNQNSSENITIEFTDKINESNMPLGTLVTLKVPLATKLSL